MYNRECHRIWQNWDELIKSRAVHNQIDISTSVYEYLTTKSLCSVCVCVNEQCSFIYYTYSNTCNVLVVFSYHYMRTFHLNFISSHFIRI